MQSVTRELLRLEQDFSWSVAQFVELEDGTRATPDSRPGTAFDYANLELTTIADESWWFRARNHMIKSLVDRYAPDSALWDIGGGVGTVAAHLTHEGVEAIVVEPDPGGACAATAKGLTAIAGCLEDLALPSSSIRSIGLFDVVEHIEDPNPLLMEVRRVLAPGGHLFITVPALPKLWSAADEEAGHFRRYTPSSLCREVEASGLTAVKTGYWFKALVGPMFATRTLPYRVGRLSRPEHHTRQLRPSNDSLVQALLRTEQILGPLPLPGTSVFGTFTAAP